MELCRIVAMLLVLLVHSGMVTFGDIGKYDLSYWGILVMESFAIVCVNMFVLISGYFSITFKWQSIVRLVWVCLFYSALSIVMSYVLHIPVSYKSFLFVSNSIWFIGTYIGLICCSPFLNAFVEKSSKQQLGGLILVLLIFQTWYDYVPRLINDLHRGYSILSFCLLYLIARYVRIYGMPKSFRKFGLVIYSCISLLISTALIYAVAAHFHPRGMDDLLLRYSNPLVIAASIGLFAFFERLDMSYSKVINYVAISCIAVLLFHTSPFCVQYVTSLFRQLFYNYSGIIVIIGWGGIVLCEFLAAVLVDQVRLQIERLIFRSFSKK